MDMKKFSDRKYLSFLLAICMMGNSTILLAGTVSNQTTSPSTAAMNTKPAVASTTASSVTPAGAAEGQYKPPIAATGVPQGAVTQAAQTQAAPVKATTKAPVYKTPEAALNAYLETRRLRLIAVYEKMEMGEAVNPALSMTVGVKGASGDGRTPEEFFTYQIVKQKDSYKVVSARRASDNLAFRIVVFNEAKKTNQDLQSLSQVSVSLGALRNGVRKSKAKINGKDYTFDARKTDAKPAQYIAENLKIVTKVTKSGTSNPGSGGEDPNNGGGTKTISVAKVSGSAVVGGVYPPGPTSYSFTVSGASQDHPVKVTVKTRQPGASAFTEEIVTVTQDGAKLNYSEPVRWGFFGEGEAKGQLIFVFTQDGKEIKPDIQYHYAP